MSAKAEFNSTARRLDLAAAIDRGEVYGYDWTDGPVFFRRRKHALGDLSVAEVKKFFAAELATWGDGDEFEQIPVRLTAAGKAWQAAQERG